MLGLLLVLSVAAVLLAGGSETSNQNPGLKTSGNEGTVEWDGRGKHVYNLQLAADDRRRFEVRQVTFTGLRGPEAKAVIEVLYEGPKPQWLQPSQLRKTFTFTVFNAGRSSIPRSLTPQVKPLSSGSGWKTIITLPRVPINYLKTNSTQILMMRVRDVMPRDVPLVVQINAFPAPGYSLGDQSAEILAEREKAAQAKAKKKAAKAKKKAAKAKKKAAKAKKKAAKAKKKNR